MARGRDLLPLLDKRFTADDPGECGCGTYQGDGRAPASLSTATIQ